MAYLDVATMKSVLTLNCSLTRRSKPQFLVAIVIRFSQSSDKKMFNSIFFGFIRIVSLQSVRVCSFDLTNAD